MNITIPLNQASRATLDEAAERLSNEIQEMTGKPCPYQPTIFGDTDETIRGRIMQMQAYIKGWSDSWESTVTENLEPEPTNEAVAIFDFAGIQVATTESGSTAIYETENQEPMYKIQLEDDEGVIHEELVNYEGLLQHIGNCIDDCNWAYSEEIIREMCEKYELPFEDTACNIARNSCGESTVEFVDALEEMGFNPVDIIDAIKGHY